MNFKLIKDVMELKDQSRILILKLELSNNEYEVIVNKWTKEIYIYWEKSKELENTFDHFIVSKNIEDNTSLDIITVSFKSDESIESVFEWLSNNNYDNLESYILI